MQQADEGDDFSDVFSRLNISARRLDAGKVQNLDMHLKDSHQLAKNQLYFHPYTACDEQGFDDVEGAAAYLKEQLCGRWDEKVHFLCDSGDIGFEMVLKDALDALPELEEYRSGHYYFVDLELTLFALLKLPWRVVIKI